MSGRSLTSQQRAAIEAEGEVLVSASAGSGKTFVMIERMVSLVLSGKAEVSGILAVTFTNLAAGEMKERLRAAIVARINAEQDAGRRAYLREQLAQIGTADISTMHSFCTSVIRRYFYETDVSGSFRVLDETEAEKLKTRAIARTFDRLLEENDEGFALLSAAFAGSRGFGMLRKTALEAYEKAVTAADPQAFLRGIPALYDRFLALYPDSPLKPALDEAIAVNRAFNEVELSPDVHILETDSVRSLAELLQPYRGRVVFIDLWATWCGPCRASFAHVAPLQEYAAANDVVLLYLSIDRPSERDKWVKMANVYHLKGEHALVGDGFKQEIYKTFGKDGYLMIPHCAVVDREGHIRFPKAAPVEQWDELQKQLEQAAQPLPAESLPFVDSPVIQLEK